MRAKRPIVLDGGLSNQLEKQGCDLTSDLWTAQVLIDDPQQIVNAHLAFLQAGARCLITSSYQATPRGFREAGFGEVEIAQIFQDSVQVALEARALFIEKHSHVGHITIAASIGPYGAYLADGSEYHGRYAISDQELRSFHRDRFDLLTRPRHDLYACETIPSLREALIIAQELEQTARGGWISFACKDETHIADGTPLCDAIAALGSYDKVWAVGINCTAPRYVSKLLQSTQGVRHDKKLILYPNSGETYNAQDGSWSAKCDAFHSNISEWLSYHPAMIGGCCRIGTEDIARLKRHIESHWARDNLEHLSP